MNNREEVRNYYEARVQKYGDALQSVNWGSEAGQQLRFSILLEVAVMDDATVLDVGCGLGDLFPLVQARGGHYTGVDLSPGMIDAAQKKYSEMDVQVRDILDNPFTKQFDYVLASGIFAIAASDNDSYMQSMMKTMWHCCRKAVAFNMLSAVIPDDNKEPGEAYYAPAEILQEALTHTDFVTVRHDYKGNDFTVYMYKK